MYHRSKGFFWGQFDAKYFVEAQKALEGELSSQKPFFKHELNLNPPSK
jgi:hypothetical protein